MLKTFFEGFCDLVYPHNCLICKKYFPGTNSSDSLCPECLNGIEPNRPPFCAKCSRFLSDDISQKLCRECRHNQYYFDRAWAAIIYNKTAQQLIHLFKYQNKTVLRKTFAKLILNFSKNYSLNISQYDLLVPVPLHPTRQRERGFNQSELLCQILSKEFQVPVSLHNLRRKRYSSKQALLSKKERWTNIRSAFTIGNPENFYHKNVIIVDDLFTTGATASEAAGVLKSAGAETVDVLTLAITV